MIQPPSRGLNFFGQHDADRRTQATIAWTQRRNGNLPTSTGVLMTGRMQSEAAPMSLLFYLTLFIVMCIFGWSVRGAGG